VAAAGVAGRAHRRRALAGVYQRAANARALGGEVSLSDDDWRNSLANIAIRARTFRYEVRRSPRNHTVRLLASLLVIDTANLTFGGRERIFRKLGWFFQQEHTMKKTILISIAVASLSTTALAGHPTHHRHLMMGHRHLVLHASTPAVDGTSLMLTSSQEHQLYLRNLHDSGYDPRHDVGPSGNMSDPANW